MSKPNTISSAEWARLQRGAADAAGGIIKTPDQAKKVQTWTDQRGNAKSN